MPRSLRFAPIALAAAMLLIISSPASAAPGDKADKDKVEHERIVKYWTQERPGPRRST